MKIYSLYSTGILALLILIACAPSLSSEQSVETAMTANHLPPCPSSPNCVCSEFPDQNAYIPPLVFTGESATAWQRATEIIRDMGGKIVTQSDNHLHATFTSMIFRFVDDLELRLAEEQKTIHLRSASRSGYWDFGVNRRRVENLRTRFTEE